MKSKGRRLMLGAMSAAALIVVAVLVVWGVSAGRSADTEETAQTDPAAEAVVYEAEEAELIGTQTASQAAGFSGSGYVTGFDEEGDALLFTVHAPNAGMYRVSVGFRAPHGDKTMSLQLNGQPAGELSVKHSDAFAEISAGKLQLDAGDNVIGILKGWGWYEIDYMKLEPADAAQAHNITKRLTDPQATIEARRLMSYLADQYGQAIMSGQQEFSNLAWLEQNVGKKPAIIGFDLIDYSPTRTKYGAKSTEIDKAIVWHNAGGIVTFAWHWNSPTGVINEPGKEWWRAFYTEFTTFDLEETLKHPDSEDYEAMISDIDVIAEQLKKLQEANVPVLFRPLHEAEGGWFWWGAKGPEPAKALYKIVHDRIVNYHQIHNLIWVWNSVDPEWYPGDDIVDIVSYDSYPQTEGDYGPVSKQYESLVGLVRDKKLVAMSENGSIPDPDQLIAYRADWSWFCTWDGEFLKDGQKNALEHLKKVYHHEYVITFDELPDLSTYEL